MKKFPEIWWRASSGRVPISPPVQILYYFIVNRDNMLIKGQLVIYNADSTAKAIAYYFCLTQFCFMYIFAPPLMQE